MMFLEPKVFILVLVALVFWVGPWRARRPLHGVLRTGVWLALVFALAHPVLRTEQGAAHRVLVLDRSASMTQAGMELGNAASEAFLEGAGKLSIVEFGAFAPGKERPVHGQRVQLAGSTDSVSDLDSALSWAVSALPAQAPAGVTLVSDGLASSGFPLRALSELRERDVPVTWVRPPALLGDVRPVGLHVSHEGNGSVRVGMPCPMVAIVEGQGQTVRCSLSEAGGDTELVRVEGVVLDGATRIPLTFEPQQPGFVSLELRVEIQEGKDARPGDETLVRPLAVQDPLRVAYLGGRMQGGAQRLADLVGPGFAISESDQDPDFRQADLVILDDRPSEAVTAAQQDRLVEAVMAEGLGLLATGGEAAFGPGGYHNQPIEQLLPVEMVQKEEKRDPSTSLVLIIDTSGSMGGNRVQLAKQVSRLAIRRLLPHDKVGIVEFYGAKRWAVPLQPASNSIEIERALNRLDAGGGTVILPAIEEAYYGLKNVRTRYKHVLILTDGGVETGAFEPLLRRMSDDGINVSTVLVGPDAHSEFLVNIANWGQGRFYSVPNRFNLPEILLKQPASAKLPAYRPGLASVSVHGGRGWWGEIDATGVPSIAGYVETRLRPGAERLIEPRPKTIRS